MTGVDSLRNQGTRGGQCEVGGVERRQQGMAEAAAAFTSIPLPAASPAPPLGM